MRPFRLWTGRLTPDAYKALLLQLDPDDDEAEQQVRMELERRTERNLRRVFRDMMETLYPEGWGGFVDPSIEATRVQQAYQREQELRDALSRALQDGADLGVSVAVQQMENIGFSFDWTLAHADGRDWALAHTDTLLQQLGTTSQRVVGQAIGRWAENGEPLEALIEDLSPVFGRNRASLIASTEVTRAVASGTIAGYRRSGVVEELVWQSAMDERRCPFCGALHGRVIGINGGSFHDELPDDLKERIEVFSYPPAHPRCRCWVSARIVTN